MPTHMNIQTIVLKPGAPGVQHSLRVWRFGPDAAPRQATIQAALHADEIPAMSFTEDQARSLIDSTIKTVEANFAEKLTALETENKNLTAQVNAVSTSGKRAEIASFFDPNARPINTEIPLPKFDLGHTQQMEAFK